MPGPGRCRAPAESRCPVLGAGYSECFVFVVLAVNVVPGPVQMPPREPSRRLPNAALPKQDALRMETTIHGRAFQGDGFSS
jgi:hypothetical protein